MPALLRAVLGALAVALLWAVPASADPTFTDPNFERQKLVGWPQVQRPTAVAFAPDGRMFVADDAGGYQANGTREPGELRVVMPGQTTSTIVDYGIEEQLSGEQDRGFTGLAVDRNFAQNGYVYLAFTYEHDPDPAHKDWVKTQRLVRIQVGPDNKYVPGSEKVLLGTQDEPHVDGLPASSGGPGQACPTPAPDVDCIPSDGKEHTIDTIRVDPNDGTLWVSIGDGGTGGSSVDPVAARAMNVNSYAGKLLHIDTDGKGLASNPFCPAETDQSKVCRKVFAMGLRNPFRFSIRPNLGQPIDGLPVIGDVGWNTREELDVASGGENFGWPCWEGTGKTPSWSASTFCSNATTGVYATGGPTGSVTAPVWEYGYEGSAWGKAIMGGPTYDGDGDDDGSADAYDPATDYPTGFRGDTIVGDYVTEEISRVRINSTGTSSTAAPFATGLEAVDWVEHPSGDLVYADLDFINGEDGPGVWRIRYAPGNRAPTAVAKGTSSTTTIAGDVVAGPAPLTVAFSSAGSSDPDAGQTLSYAWDFTSDGTTDSTAANPTHTYTDGTQNRTATLTVSDGSGRSATDTVLVSPGNRPPVATITSAPTWRSGEQITVAGTVTDPDGGTVTLNWDVKLKHNTHFHDAGGNPTFVADPARDHHTDATYEVRLTATDTRGLTHTAVAELLPETAQLTVDSSPAGAPIEIGGVGGLTAPHSMQAAIDSRPSVSAAQSFTKDGVDYQFSGWSDGGTSRLRTVDVAETGTSVTAQYAPAAATGETYYASLGGSGTACSSGSPCALNDAITKANATPGTLDTIQVVGALSRNSTIDLDDSPIRLIGSGAFDNGTRVQATSGPALWLGSLSRVENVKLIGPEFRVVRLKEGGDLTDVTVQRSATGYESALIGIEPTTSTGSTHLTRVRAEQPSDGLGTGIGVIGATSGTVADLTVVEDSEIVGPRYGIQGAGGRIVLQRSTIEAEENGITLADLPTVVDVSGTVLRALPQVGATSQFFNGVRARGGATITARHITIDGTRNTALDPDDGHPLRDGFDIDGTAEAPTTVDVRHSAILNTYSSLECISNGRIDVQTTAYDPANGVSSPSCPVVQGAGNRLTMASPGFVDAANGNFRLRPSSPLVDAAGTSILDPAESGTDLRGKTRIFDGDLDGTAERDMGAYELGGPPVASFTGPTSIDQNHTAQFDASASTADAPITAYEWDLDGDNVYETTTTEPTVSRQYTTPGSRTIRLRVSDGRTGTPATRTLTVAEPGTVPTASFTGPDTVDTGATATFDASGSSSSSTITGYAWDLDGDDVYETTTTTPTVQHVYTTPGARTVRLKATNATGTSTPATRTVTVQDPPPVTTGATYHVAAPGSGTACTSAAPCPLDAAVTKANATPLTRDTIRIAGALTRTSPVDLDDSPIVLIGSGSGTGGTKIAVPGAPALWLGAGSRAEAVRLEALNFRVVRLKEGGDLDDAVIVRNSDANDTFGAPAIGLEATAGTDPTELSDLRISQANTGMGTGIGVLRNSTDPQIADVTVLEDSEITGPEHALQVAGGKLVVRRSRLEAESNGISADSVATTVEIDSTVIRALAAAGDPATTFFNGVRLRTGSSVLARHVVVDGSRQAGTGQELRDGFDLAGAVGTPVAADVRHSVVLGVSSAFNCADGSLTVGNTAAASFSSGNGSCPVVETGGNRGNADLGFVDAAAGDFRLRGTSPLVDAAGTSVLAAGESATDIRGAARRFDGDLDGTVERDIGAYELGAAPTAAFTGPAQVTAGSAATFDAATSSGDAPIVSYQWDLDGNGTFETTTTQPTVTRSYATAGAVTVRLRVSDGRLSAPVQRSLDVQAAPAPPVQQPPGGGDEPDPEPAPAPKVDPPPATTTPQDPPAPPARPRLASLRLTSSTLTVTGKAKDRFTIPIACPASAAAPCTGTIRSSFTQSRTYRVSPGRTLKATVKLTKSGRAKLRRARRLKIRLTVTRKDASALTRTVTVRLPRARRP